MSELFENRSSELKLSSGWHLHLGRVFGFLIKDKSLKLPYPSDIEQNATIIASEPATAQALANLLILHLDNYAGWLTVEDSKGVKYSPQPIEKQESLYANLMAAFKHNPRIERIVKVPDSQLPYVRNAVVMICKKELIVHYADDMSDPFLNRATSAASAIAGGMINLYNNGATLVVTTVNERDFG